jgi:hypothetical protein
MFGVKTMDTDNTDMNPLARRSSDYALTSPCPASQTACSSPNVI